MKKKIRIDDNYTEYAVVIKNKEGENLLAVQTYPETKFFFKDKEVSIEELINILEQKDHEKN